MTTPLDRARELFVTLDAAADAATPTEPLPRSSLDLLDEARLSGLMVPRAVGGQELALADLVDVYAEVSRADGSLGWCYFASDLTAAYFGAYLPDDGVAAVFADGVPRMAGQLAPNGTSVRDGDAIVLDGDYQFGSGIAHAEWLGSGALTEPDADGNPGYVIACFPARDADPKGNWDVLGLQATASYDYAVRQVRVPDSQLFDFFAPTVHRGSAMHLLGVLPLAAAGHAGWALGVTRRVLDELTALAASTTRMGSMASLADSERFLFELANLESRHRSCVAYVRDVLTATVDEAEREGGVSELAANLVREAARYVNQTGADVARQAYLLAGTKALRDGPMQRGFRDLHAGSQHFFASPTAALDFSRTLLAPHP
jgi:alkylation response protein AidB-like acyl-CoA dehydrogenase